MRMMDMGFHGEAAILYIRLCGECGELPQPRMGLRWQAGSPREQLPLGTRASAWYWIGGVP